MPSEAITNAEGGTHIGPEVAVVPRIYDSDHGADVERELEGEVEIVLKTDLTSNREAYGIVGIEPEIDACTGADIPMETFDDVPPPLVGGIEAEAVEMPVDPTEVEFNAIELGTHAEHGGNFHIGIEIVHDSDSPTITAAETESDGILFTVTLCKGSRAESEDRQQYDDEFFHCSKNFS